MSDEKRRLRDEVAELSEAVRELREELSRQKNHVCCPGTCLHWHYYPVPSRPVYPAVAHPYVVTCGGSTDTSITYINTAGAAPTTLTYNVGETALGAINYS